MSALALPGIALDDRKPELSQWYTPPQLAERIVSWALEPFVVPDPIDVLEPSAGRGALVKPLLARGVRVDAFDIDPDNVRALCRLDGSGLCARQVNFLSLEPTKMAAGYNLAVMNPPFEDDAVMAHVLHALRFAERVVCHAPLTTLAGQARRVGLWSKVELHRLAICGTRPSYGADGGKTDMCTFDVTLASDARRRHWAHDVRVEFWP